MVKRARLWLVVFIAGLLALLWGLAALEALLLRERNEARTTVQARARVLEQYAARTLQLRLRTKLTEARPDIERAQRDPFLDARHIVLFEHGTQILPQAPGSEHTTSVERLCAALASGARIDAAPQSPWADRILLFTDFREAAQRGERARLEQAFKALMEHRSRHLIDSRLDIPLRITTLELLSDQGPSPELMLALLREGMPEQHGVPGRLLFEGLQPALLRRAPRFSDTNLQHLGRRVVALSHRFDVAASDFELRLADPRRGLDLEPPPAGPALLAEGRYFVVPDPLGTIVGIAIDFSAELDATVVEMRQRGLLGDDDRLLEPEWKPGPTLVRTLQIDLHAPRFVTAAELLEHRFRLKSAFVVLSGVLATGLVGLAIAFGSRRRRFVELKASFVAAVSHELRTPLASIRLMAETLERKTKDFTPARDYPTRIVGQADDLAFMVENLLSFNRLDQGRWTPRRERIDGLDLVALLREDLETLAPRELRIEAHGFDDLVLDADPELMRLLLRNLGKNACNYNERTPVALELSAQTGATGLEIRFRDNGVGIPRTEQRRVFIDFYRPTKTQVRGSGLGLALCRSIVRAHGGAISITRSGPEGTTFTLTFPRTMLGSCAQ